MEILRLIVCAVFCLCVFSGIARAADEPHFFSALQDVPLAPGLDELSDQSVEFDKPEGRIVESVALAQEGASEDSIRSFYDATLPELGWKKAGSGSFTREKERLLMNFESEKGRNYLRVNVAPAE